MAKKKKDKSVYDENGRWVQERGQIKGAVRRVFRKSPQMLEVRNAARVELPPALKKDGTPGKRNQVRFKCAMCRELFQAKKGRSSLIQVDHFFSVVPLWKNEADMTYDEIVRGVFCDKKNLQVLCSTPLKLNNNNPSCHKKKTDEENWIRKAIAADNLQKVIEADVKFGLHKKWINKYKEKYKEHLKEKKDNGNRKRKSKKR